MALALALAWRGGAGRGVARHTNTGRFSLMGVSVQPGGTAPAGALQAQGAAAPSTAAAASRPPAPAHPAGPTTQLPHAPTSALAHGPPALPQAVGTPTMIGIPNPPAATAPPLNGNSPAPATRTPTNRISFRHRSMAGCCCGPSPSLCRDLLSRIDTTFGRCAHLSQHATACPFMLPPCSMLWP